VKAKAKPKIGTKISTIPKFSTKYTSLSKIGTGQDLIADDSEIKP
jgi:hypothetical protein